MNLFKTIFSKIAGSDPVYYESIHDLPVGIFNQIIETNDYSLLVQKGKLSEKEQYKVWFKIYDEFLRVFGTPQQYLEYARLMRKWRDEILRVWNGEKYRESFAQFALNEAKEITTNIDNQFYKILTIVSKQQGHPINPQKISVYMFYCYVRTLEEQQLVYG